jgi:hypothetical protein
MAANKLIPDGMLCCHHCDNPRCVNVLMCLFIGTNQDNMKDKVNKNRQASGENNGQSKTNCENVKEIRYKYNNNINTQTELSVFYKLSLTNICDIINNKTWYDPDYTRINFTNATTILTLDIANKIREEHATGKYTQRQLANMFNIGFSSIHLIIKNKQWKIKNE